MNPESLHRDLAELFDSGAPEVTLEEVEERSLEEARRPKPARPAWVAIGAFIAVVIGGLAIGLLTRPIGPTAITVPPASTPTSASTPTTSTETDSSGVFVPPIRSAEGTTHLTLTLLDGGHIKLAYPSELDLTSAGVSASTVGSLEGEHSRQIEVYFGSSESWVAMIEEHSGPGQLTATFTRDDGRAVERWEFPEQPIAYLVYDFAPWTVYVWDGMGDGNPPMGEEAQLAWANTLWGEIYDPGFLVLRSEPPLQLVPAADAGGPSGPDIRVDGSSGSLLVFKNDCERMGELDDEDYGQAVFAFCDEASNTLFFVGGDAEVQERVHRELVVDPLPDQVDRETPPLDQATGSRVFFSTDTQLTVVDVDAGTVAVHDLPELAPGDPPYRLAWRGERLVFYGQTEVGPAVYAADPADAISPEVIDENAWFFVPSADPGRVWVADLDESSPDTVRALESVREVTIDGVITTPDVTPPDGRWPIATVNDGLVFQGDDVLEVWDPTTLEFVSTIPGPFPVATWGNRLVTCTECDRLHLIDLDRGTERTVDLPVGVAFAGGYDGAFSPDGRHVAVLGFLTPAPITEETEMVVVLVDFEQGTSSIVPGTLSRNQFAFPAVTWSSTGWLFIASVLDEAETTGRLLAYRPGEETAYQVSVDLGTVYYGMAAD